MPFLLRCPGCNQYYVVPQSKTCRHKCRREPGVSTIRRPACSQTRKPVRCAAIIKREVTEAIGSRHPLQRSLADLRQGMLASAIGCTSTVVLWISLATTIQADIGWMAWVVGGLTGFGMSCRPEDRASSIAGVLAAATAISGVMIAKAATFLTVVLPLLQQIPAESEGSTLTLFSSAMFKTMDALFLAAGALTAYWLGSRGASNES